MAIKAGQILHVGNGNVVIDRIQTAGPGNLNIPTEKIYELGNYESVATIRDIPDLTFSLESLDTSTEIEAWLLGVDPATTNAYDIAAAKAVDVVSPFKAGKDTGATAFDIVTSVGLPYLTMDSLSYRFGLRDNARQTVGLRGDSIFYNPGHTHVQRVMGTGTAGQTIATDHPAFAYTDGSGTRRVLSVVVGNKRLAYGPDYTLADGAVAGGAAVSTVTLTEAVATTTEIRVMYSTPNLTQFPQSVHALVDGTPPPPIKPAAVRGKDIDVYLSPANAPFDPANPNPLMKFGTVQAVTCDWRVTMERDEEFGNYFSIGQDFDVPTVNGTIDIRPRDPQDMLAKIRRITGVADATRVLGPNDSTPLALDIVVKDGAHGGQTLKRLNIPDARFTLPGFTGTVQQRLTLTLNWESDGGKLNVFKA